MFVGHLAAGLVLKARVRDAPLSWLLFATVLPDLLCGLLLLIGLEHVVVEGAFVFGQVRAEIGYSHSLLASMTYAVLAGWLSAKRWRSTRIGVAVGLAALSHFVLDALSHRPDMPVLGFGAASDVRLGTNLALHPLAFFLVELGWCLIAWRVFDAHNRRLLVVLLVLMGLYTNTIFGFAPPPPLSAAGIGLAMLVTFSVAAGLLFWAAAGSERTFEPSKPGERRIVCAGDSLTRGSVSFDYVQALRDRLGPSVRVFNAGVNGDLAFNLAERLPAIVACAPDDVVILIGTNDICGAQTPAVARQQKRVRKLPELPTQAFFERQLTRMLRGLREATTARIVVVTPPLLGEDLSHPVHARLCAYARRASEIAQEHGATVIALHEAMANALTASGHKPRPGFHPGLVELSWMAMVPVQRHLAGMSYDRIARRHGLWGSPDLVHLTESSGAILVALLEQHLRAVLVDSSSVPGQLARP